MESSISRSEKRGNFISLGKSFIYLLIASSFSHFANSLNGVMISHPYEQVEKMGGL